MPSPFTVVDAVTDGIYGPFDTLRDARTCAEDLRFYEILNEEGALVEWNTRLPRPPAQEV